MSEPLHWQVNYRIEVWPDVRFINSGHKSLCDHIAAGIKRHVDDVADVEIRSDCVCRTCGNRWEEPPICCDAAIDGWQREHPEWTLDENYNWHKAVGHE
jgi:hypothetical protein